MRNIDYFSNNFYINHSKVSKCTKYILEFAGVEITVQLILRNAHIDVTILTSSTFKLTKCFNAWLLTFLVYNLLILDGTLVYSTLQRISSLLYNICYTKASVPNIRITKKTNANQLTVKHWRTLQKPVTKESQSHNGYYTRKP